MLTLELSSRLLEIPQWCVYNKHSVNSDRLFNTQSWVLQVDWFIFEINEKATLNIDMPYYYFVIPGKKRAIYSSLTFLCSHLSFPATQVLHHWWVLNGVCQSWPQGSQIFLMDTLATLPQCNFDWNRKNYSVKILHSDSSTELSWKFQNNAVWNTRCNFGWTKA